MKAKEFATLLSLWVALGVVPLIAAAEPPNLSELKFLTGDTLIEPAAGVQDSPEIARGGDLFLAVWVDDRTALTRIPTFTGGPRSGGNIGSMWDIYAARIDADGNLIDQSPIVVAQQILNQGMPDVAWNGENWLVVWSGQQGMSCCPDIHAYAARVSPAGELLDDPPILLDADYTGNGLYWPCVGSDGNNWVAVWRDLDEAAGIFTLDGTRVSPTGEVLDPGGVRLRRDSYNSYPIDPDIAFAGDEFLLVWTENSGGVRGQRLTTTLERIGNVFTINTGQSSGLNPRVATNGTEYFVAWWEDIWYGWSQLAGSRVSHTGQILDPGGIDITEAYGYTNYEPAVAWDGMYYYVAYDKDAFSPDMRVSRIAPDGQVLDYNGVLVSGAQQQQRQAAVASMPSGGVLILWSDLRDSWDVRGATVTRDAGISPEAVYSMGAPRQTQLRIAPNGDGYLAVFRSETSARSSILVQRLDMNGNPIDGEPIEVATGGPEVTHPSIAWNGSVYFVVWERSDQNQIYGKRLTPDAVPIEVDPISLLPGNVPDVAALGDLFLVASTHEPTDHVRYIKTVRVRGTDGLKLDASPFIAGGSYALAPRVIAFAGRWLATWGQLPTHDSPRANVVANFIEPDGTPGSSFLVRYDAIQSSRAPHVAVSDLSAMIVWDDNRGGTEERDIYGRRLLPSGTFLDPSDGILLASAANSQFSPSIAWDGEEYLLDFSDDRADNPLDQHRGDLYGTRVSAVGEVLDPLGFAVANDTIPELHGATAAQNSRGILAGSVFRPGAPFVAYRIGLRVVNPQTVNAEDVADLDPRFGIRVAPNPSLGSIEISLRLPAEGQFSLIVYDAVGRRTRTLHDGWVSEGERSIKWDGRDDRGRKAAPGVYFARLRGAGVDRTVKILRD